VQDLATPKPLKVFISYSHKDERFREQLQEHLYTLKRQDLIEDWYDRKIPAGEDWENVINENLETAEIILLLVSPSFIASPYSYNEEMKRALERHESGQARVIPIILRPVNWLDAPFASLQAVPRNGKPVIKWSNRDEAWLDVTKEIQKRAKELLQEQTAKEQYREAVQQAWLHEKLSSDETEQLGALAGELRLRRDTAAAIEHRVMGDTIEGILERQEQADRQERLKGLYDVARELYEKQEWQAVGELFAQIHAEDPNYPDPERLLTSAHEAMEIAQKEEEALGQYHEAVESAWQDGELHGREVDTLRDLADKLKLGPSHTGEIELEIMGDTIEDVLEHQEQAAREERRRSRLQGLYARARQLHRDRRWQAVIDLVEQIHAEDSSYPDRESLLVSAREALEAQERAQSVAATYDKGLRHLDAREWQQARECFEEVQRLESGYRDSERLLQQIQDELTGRRRWEYANFDLEIHQPSESREYPVSVRSMEGEAQAEMRFPFDEWELKDKLRELEVALLRSGETRRRLGMEDERAGQEFGQALFDALLVGEVRAHYEASLRKARQQHKGLRLKLHVEPSELSALPWEFLYDSEHDYLGLSSMTPLVRYLDVPQSVEQPAVTLPLRILGMVASPQGLPQLKVRREKRLVEEAVKELQAKGLVELAWVEGQTWRDLRRSMRREEDWHIFHFVGHGGFDTETEEGAIALADEEGRKDLLRATDLARLLEDHYPLRLVFLNSCEGARGSESDAFSSTAATLVRHRVPAVVAMQYEITDKAAIEFSRDFYEAVADGLPVDAAVTEARTAIRRRSALEWGTPVLYTRSSDGLIFDIQKREFDDQRGDLRKEPEPGRFKTLPGWESGSATSSSPNEQEPRPGRFESLPGW
jgi:CHAT domain/TIR domain